MTTTRRSRTRQTGYTIIEVVVALAVAGIALAGLLHAVGGNATRSALSREFIIATTFSESMLARVGRDIALDTGTVQGRMGGIFSWRRSIRPYPIDHPAGAVEAPLPVSPYEVTVSVRWRSGGDSHEFSLRSLRLKLGQVDAST